MQIRQLEYFVAVAEQLNFTKAARQFYISQTAVAAGLGYALLPTYITDSLSMKEKVIAVPLEGEEKKIPIIAAWHKQNQNPALGRFLDDCLIPAREEHMWG